MSRRNQKMDQEDFQHLFPYRLHRVLEQVEQKGLTHIVSWLPCGTVFRVHDIEAFAEEVMPKIGRFTRYKSFLRQLSMYKFQRLSGKSAGPLLGAYKHPYFRRDHIELCRGVLRGESYLPTRNGTSSQGEAAKAANSHISCCTAEEPMSTKSTTASGPTSTRCRRVSEILKNRSSSPLLQEKSLPEEEESPHKPCWGGTLNKETTEEGHNKNIYKNAGEDEIAPRPALLGPGFARVVSSELLYRPPSAAPVLSSSSPSVADLPWSLNTASFPSSSSCLASSMPSPATTRASKNSGDYSSCSNPFAAAAEQRRQLVLGHGEQPLGRIGCNKNGALAYPSYTASSSGFKQGVNNHTGDLLLYHDGATKDSVRDNFVHSPSQEPPSALSFQELTTRSNISSSSYEDAALAVRSNSMRGRSEPVAFLPRRLSPPPPPFDDIINEIIATFRAHC